MLEDDRNRGHFRECRLRNCRFGLWLGYRFGYRRFVDRSLIAGVIAAMRNRKLIVLLHNEFHALLLEHLPDGAGLPLVVGNLVEPKQEVSRFGDTGGSLQRDHQRPNIPLHFQAANG